MPGKVAIIGAGNVGATVALAVAQQDIVSEVVLLDIKEGVAEGKALDIWESGPVHGFATKVWGVTNDYSAVEGAQLVVITSGVPRRPGMSRDDLVRTNAKIVKEVTERVVAVAPDAILLVVSNPLDVMTYTAWKVSGFEPERVVGMAGVLDVARYRTFIAEAVGVSPEDVQAMLMGGHGDSMVPLPRYTTVCGVPVTEFLDEETIQKIVERTRFGGGEIVNYLGVSAWYAPGASVALMVEAIIKDKRRFLPACAYVRGEYGIQDLYMGVPVILGGQGVERVVELKLSEDELRQVHASAEHVRRVLRVVQEMGII